MKTVVVILVVAVLAGIALMVLGAVKTPTITTSEQPVHKLPTSPPPAAGAQETK